MDPIGFKLLLLLPAPFLPVLTWYLAISDQIGGAFVAGVFSVANTILLTVLTVRYQRSRRNGDNGSNGSSGK